MFKSFQNSDKLFTALTVVLIIMKHNLTIWNRPSSYSLEQRVISLESQVSNLQQPTFAINNDQSQMNTDNIVNQTAVPTIQPIAGDSTSHIGLVVSTFLNKEKVKAKWCLNLLVPNVKKSMSDNGLTRKQHDIHTISFIFQQQFHIICRNQQTF